MSLGDFFLIMNAIRDRGKKKFIEGSSEWERKSHSQTADIPRRIRIRIVITLSYAYRLIKDAI